jgi:aromatase
MTAQEMSAQHSIVIDAPPSTVYALITNVALWPVIFPPTVHTEVLERSAEGDRFDIWATMSSGAVSTWRSRRTFDASTRRVTFGQDHDNRLFGFMGGGWTCVPLVGGGTRVELDHRYNLPEDSEDARQRITRELDHNGTAELKALQAVATLPKGMDKWMVTFTDSVELAGTADAAREFIWDADRWPERLPHVDGLELATPADGTQDMTMKTRAPDGSVHTTRSVRVLLPDGSIVYKQTQPPRALLGHTGRWEFRTDESGASIRSTHTIVVDPAGAAEVYGASVSAGEAVDRVRAALSANSGVTMNHAAEYSTAIGAAR